MRDPVTPILLLVSVAVVGTVPLWGPRVAASVLAWVADRWLWGKRDV